MTTEYHDNAVEEATNGSSCDDNAEIDVFLRITPVLSFASGPEPGIQTGNGCEPQRPVLLEKLSTQSGRNHKKTNWISSDNVEKHESKKARAKKMKLDGPAEGNTELPTTPGSSPTTGRTNRMLLIRSLSSSAPAALKEVSPRQTRRLSDPTVPCQKSLVKSFDRQASLKKLRPYLKRRAVSPLHLLGKVAASSGSKHNNHDTAHSKERKGNRVRLARRLYPSFSKAYDQLTQKVETRRGSDPSGVPSEEGKRSLLNDYDTIINDFSNQMQDLAVNLENLTTTDKARGELAASGILKTSRQHGGEINPRENDTGQFFKDDDIRLQEMLEEVLRSHILTMDNYSPTSCDRASRSICKIITRLLGKQPGYGKRKLACLVYIGAVRDSGIQMAAQALWNPDEDTFAAASFRNESVYGFAVVIATPAFSFILN